MNIYKKVIAGIILSFILATSVSAYDLTEKDIAKGEQVTAKLIQLINTKSEARREAFKTKIVDTLNNLKDRARKNERIVALVGYVVDKLLIKNTESLSGTVMQYPGCISKDIALNNGQVWSACDIGTTMPGQDGEKFAYGSNYGYKDLSNPNMKGSGTDWSEIDSRGPCAEGYHVPSKIDFDKAIIATKDSGINKIFDFNIKENGYGYYNTTTLTDYGTWFFLGSQGTYNWFGKDSKGFIRCIKD